MRIVAAEAIWHGAATRYTRGQRSAWIRTITNHEASALMVGSEILGWVAIRKGQVVAFMILSDSGELFGPYVRPGLTRRGIGRELLAEAERQARTENVLTLTAQVSLISDALFQRAGFAVIRREMLAIDGEHLSVARMEKSLS